MMLLDVVCFIAVSGLLSGGSKPKPAKKKAPPPKDVVVAQPANGSNGSNGKAPEKK